MKILPLGTGNGFTRKFFHSNLLIGIEGQYMLVDAGTTLRYSLKNLEIHPSQITAIFITHFHHDHAGGLAEFLMQCHWYFQNGRHTPHRPILLLRPSQLEEVHGILAPMLNNQGLTWKDYCTVRMIENNVIHLNELRLQVLPTDNLHCANLKSCGLKVTTMNGTNFIISGDIKKLSSSNILSHIDQRTQAIVQDVSFDKNSVHSTYEEVLDYYPLEYYPIIYGTHYEDNFNPNEKYQIHFLEEGKPLLLS